MGPIPNPQKKNIEFKIIYKNEYRGYFIYYILKNIVKNKKHEFVFLYIDEMCGTSFYLCLIWIKS